MTPPEPVPGAEWPRPGFFHAVVVVGSAYFVGDTLLGVTSDTSWRVIVVGGVELRVTFGVAAAAALPAVAAFSIGVVLWVFDRARAAIAIGMLGSAYATAILSATALAFTLQPVGYSDPDTASSATLLSFLAAAVTAGLAWRVLWGPREQPA